MTSGADDFASFYAASYPRLIALTAAQTGDLGRAEDITRRAFALALGRWPDVGENPEAWVRREAGRLVLGAGRRSPMAPLGETDLSRVLMRMSAEQRQAVVLTHLAGLPVDEVARDTGESVATIRMRLATARLPYTDELAEYIADWVRPATEAPVPGLDALHRRMRQRRMRTAAAVLGTGVVIAGLGVAAWLGPTSAPRHTVAISQPSAPLGWNTAGWMLAGPPSTSLTTSPFAVRLPVGRPADRPADAVAARTKATIVNVFTGDVVQTIVPPGTGGFTFAAAAADDRTFVLTEQTGKTSYEFYELQLGPGGQPGSLVRLGAATGQLGPTALSPDGRMLALSSYGQDFGGSPTGTVEVVSLATGKHRSWTTGGAVFELSWAADDRSIGFYFPGGTDPGSGFRILDTAAGGPDLMKDSRLVIPDTFTGSQDGPALGSTALTADGSAVIATLNTQFGSIPVTTSSGESQENIIPTAGHVLEYSSSTGHLLRPLTSLVTSPATGNGLSCWPLWSNPSGSQVVSYCQASTAPGSQRVVVFQNGRYRTLTLAVPGLGIVAW